MKTLEEYIELFENNAAQTFKVSSNLTKENLPLTAEKVEDMAHEHLQLAEWLRTLKDVKTAIKVGNKLLDQDGCDHEMAFDVYSSIYCQIEKLVEEVKADGEI